MQAVSGNIKTPVWLWIAALAFVAVNAVFIAFEVYYIPLVPVLILFVLVAFTRMDILLLSIVFFAPFSLQLSYFVEGIGVDLYLPTEFMLATLLLVYGLRYTKGIRTDLRIFRHPVTLAIYFNLAWMVITIFTSSDPLVSVKFFISRLWFIVGFYLVAIEIFRKRDNMQRYVWMYIASFTVIIAYTLIRHSEYGLDNQMMAHSMMQPFYKDHTSYGATLAFLLPVLITFIVLIKRGNLNAKFLMTLLTMGYVGATLFSYTRAAWVSIIGSLGVWAAIKLRIRFEIIVLTIGTVVALFFMFQPMIIMRMEANRTKSSGDFTEHVQSIYNISNDQSNLERINRWSCAIRMWKERPVFGFGPGTYQFEYGRFQRSFERTEISTNFGSRGTAHSEYLGPLSESGLLGMVSFLLIIIVSVMTGLRVYLKAKSRYIRVLSLGILIGLVTYYIHGILNNFLDSDKTSALFWGFTAMLVAMDIFHKDTEEPVEGETEEGSGAGKLGT
ncbi:MAG: O-antigen ligase family protein [Bacteroidales bacterium]